MNKIFWNLYGWVYDTVIQKLIPYQNMVEGACELLDPQSEGVYFDAGCGTGNLLFALAKSRGDLKLVGADQSGIMLKRARTKNAVFTDRVALYKLDLNSRLPFTDQVFDGIICINVLYVLHYPEAFLQELNRVLKGGGRLVLATPLDEPKLLPVIEEHIEVLKKRQPRRWRLILISQVSRALIPVIIFFLINVVIVKNQKYTFYKKADLRKVLESNGFRLSKNRLIYGDQVWLLLAAK